MVQLLTQFAFVHQLGQPHFAAAVDQAEGHLCIWLISENRLTHQQLVKVSVDQGPHDWINSPIVVVHPCGDVDHGSPFRISGI